MLRIPKNQLVFGLLYAVFIFSEQIADDESALALLSNRVDELKVKYVIILLAIGLLALKCLRNNRRYMEFRAETINILIIIIVLTFITVIMHLRNGIMLSSYNEVFFWLVPIMYVFLLVNNISSIVKYINTAFVIQFIVFLIGVGEKLSVSNILAINFIESNSAFESEHSFYGLVFFMFYIYVKDKPRSVLSFIMTFFAFKRIAVVFAIFIFVLNFFPIRKIFYNKPNKRIVMMITGVFIVIPLVFHLVCSDGFGNWFTDLTGLDLNLFISGRLDRLNLCIDNEMKYGLGSTTQFLNQRLANDLSRSLHNDVLKMYLECGFLGTLVFTVNYFKISRQRSMSFLLMTYLFTDMTFNHFLGAGRTAFWIIIYLIIYYFNNNDQMVPEKSKSKVLQS